MSGKFFTVFLISAIALVLLAAGFVVYLMAFGGRDDITMCNDSGAPVVVSLVLHNDAGDTGVFEETTLAPNDCVNTRVLVNIDTAFRLVVDGTEHDFGYLTTHYLTAHHKISIQAPDRVDYRFEG